MHESKMLLPNDHVRSENCSESDALVDNLLTETVEEGVKRQLKAEKYVVLTILLFALFFLLSISRKRFPKVQINKIVSSTCYMLIPVLLTYTLGLMGQIQNTTLGSIWSVLLLYVYGSFDNLTAISLDERNGRMKLFAQFLSNFVLAMLLIISHLEIMVVSHLVLFVLLCFKVVERIVALAYAAGATPRIRKNMRKMIKYMNKNEEEEVDPVSMHGYNYLVGPRYSETKQGFIVKGISIEDVWGCNGSLLRSESGGAQLKDTCLSFALFWLLLGKFWGCRLYDGDDSRRKAWKLVHDGLLGGKLGENYQRVFRVIEVELNFLQDYFYSKYMVFYLHGFYLKLCILAFPIMFWWYTFKLVDYEDDDFWVQFFGGVDPHETPIPTGIVSLVILFLEVIQLGMLISSRWFQVTLLSYYVNKEMSKNENGLLGCCFDVFVGIISHISQWSNTILFKPWKRELDQYSLLESCNSFGVQSSFLQQVSAVFGFLGLPKVGRKQAKSVVLSEDVKSAVVLSLQTNGPKLSNGVFTLRRNEVEEDLSWGCKLECDSESILVWHIATSICEMRRNSQQNIIQSTEDSDFKVATSLSKYCAYLLVFSPYLLHVPLVEAEDICDIAINEARELLFKKHVSRCGHVDEINKYEILKELISDEEARVPRNSTILRGAKLGEDLLSIVKDEGRRWKILAEFWAEMILFLASLNNNEVAHVEKLGEGGEFITHLWALLVHAGMVD